MDDWRCLPSSVSWRHDWLLKTLGSQLFGIEKPHCVYGMRNIWDTEVYIYTLYINVYNVYMYLGRGNFRYLMTKKILSGGWSDIIYGHTHFVWSYFVWYVRIDTPGRFKLSVQLSRLCLQPCSHVYSHKFWLKVTLPHPTSHPQPQPTTSNHK